jgi:WD40 repeat protein
MIAVAQPGGRHEGEAFSCAYTPDGSCVLSGGWDGHLRLWDASTGTHLAALRAAPKPLSCCAFTPDATQWVAGSMEGLLSFWDAVSHQTVQNFVAHTRPISAICYAPDGEYLATASWDRQVSLRQLGKEREGRNLSGHTDIVAGCRFAPGGKHLLSWSHDGSVRLWDVATAQEVCAFNGHADRVNSASLSPDGRRAVSGGRDGVVRLWDLDTRSEAGSANLEREVRLCAFLLDGESLLVVDATGRLLLLAVPSFEVQSELETKLKVMCAELAPSGFQVALGCEDGVVSFAALEGFEDSSIVVTAFPTLKPTAGLFGRLMGKTRLTRTYQYTCPVCRQSQETTTLPRQPVSCARCRRRLRVNAEQPLLASS